MKDFHVRGYEPVDMMRILGEMEEYPEWIFNRTKWGPGYTFKAPGGEIIGCAGLLIYTEHFGEVWLEPGPLWADYKREAVIFTGSLLARWDNEYNLTRTQAVVDADNKTNQRFIEHYGFEREGLLRAFGSDGRDMYMYAKVRR